MLLLPEGEAGGKVWRMDWAGCVRDVSKIDPDMPLRRAWRPRCVLVRPIHLTVYTEVGTGQRSGAPEVQEPRKKDAMGPRGRETLGDISTKVRNPVWIVIQIHQGKDRQQGCRHRM